MSKYTVLVLAHVAAVGVCLFLPSTCEGSQQLDCPIVNCDDFLLAQKGVQAAFRGVYTFGFEMSDFVPAGSDCRWWLTGNTEAIRAAAGLPEGMDRTTVRIEVQGVVSQPGCYGHMGIYRRELTVTRIVSAEGRSPGGQGWVPLTVPVLPTPTLPGSLPPEKLRQ